MCNYEKRIVLYLDLLGFKNKVDKSIENVDIRKKIFNILTKLYKDKEENYSGTLNGSMMGDHVSVFSDNIVYSVLLNSEDGFFKFSNVCYYLILECIYQGFIARGAIYIGDLFHNEKIVFGPALNEAYSLESTNSIYPRIIMKRDQFNDALESMDYVDRNYIKMFDEDDDGFMFLNYIKDFHELEKENYQYFISKLREIIISGLNTKDDKIKQKYEWLKTKFNKYNTYLNI